MKDDEPMGDEKHELKDITEELRQRPAYKNAKRMECAVQVIRDCVDRLRSVYDQNPDEEGGEDWWINYWTARSALKELALIVISSPLNGSHPDRISIDFKSVTADITDEIRTIENPGWDSKMCPKCGKMGLLGGNEPCFVCFVKKETGLDPIPGALDPPDEDH